MKPMPEVLDVSSGDEEDQVVCLEDKLERIIDFDWIKEFLDIQDEKPNDVAVLNEGSKPEPNSKSSVLTAGVKSVDDDDGDCVVLDGDPETRVTTFDDSPTGSDDLVVVGEKGQIACRDYPHPRHLCVKFPYSSTRHEKHCYQCHCYVCDSVAPCLKWGTGLLGTDHCHATDKSETWRTMRTNFMLGRTASLPASTNYSTVSDVGSAQQNHILPLGIMLLSPNSMLLNQTSMSMTTRTGSLVNLMPQNQVCSSLNSIPPNQLSRPNTVPEGSIASNFTIPSSTNYCRYRESGSALVRNRYQSHSFPQNLLGVRNHAIQRVRQHGVRSFGPHFLLSHPMLNGLGSVGVGSTLQMNHSTHGTSGGFSNHVNPALEYARYSATGISYNSTCYRQNDVYGPQNFLYPNPFSQANNLSYVSKYTTAHETQASYQSNGSQNFSAYSVQSNNVPSSNVVGLSRNQVINEPLIGSQQKHYDVSRIESALNEDFSAFESSRAEDTNQSILYEQSSGSMNISSSANNSGTQFTGSTGLGSVDDIEHWLLNEEDSVPVGTDGALASEMNMPSPDPSTFDVGTLFDYENYWNCVAHV